MHYTKFGKASCGPVLEHCERGIGKKDNHHHSNENIDPTRTPLNYDLHERNGLTAYQFYQKRLNEIEKATKERTGKSVRKDAVTLCSWIVTVPQSFPKKDSYYKKFFQKSYDFFAERYGKQNIVAATVHMDEVTPHMHFLFMPVQKNERLCAKNLETRQTLSEAHIQLQKTLEKYIGCKVPLLNGSTVGGSMTVLELKEKSLNEKCEKLNDSYTKLKAEHDEVKSSHLQLKKETDELEKKKESMENWFLKQKPTSSDTKEVKGLFGKVKTVPKTEQEKELDQQLKLAQNAYNDYSHKLMLTEQKKNKLEEKEKEVEKKEKYVDSYIDEKVEAQIRERLKIICEIMEKNFAKEKDELQKKHQQELSNAIAEKEKEKEKEIAKLKEEGAKEIKEFETKVEVHKSLYTASLDEYIRLTGKNPELADKELKDKALLVFKKRMAEKRAQEKKKEQPQPTQKEQPQQEKMYIPNQSYYRGGGGMSR